MFYNLRYDVLSDWTPSGVKVIELLLLKEKIVSEYSVFDSLRFYPFKCTKHSITTTKWFPAFAYVCIKQFVEHWFYSLFYFDVIQTIAWHTHQRGYTIIQNLSHSLTLFLVPGKIFTENTGSFAGFRYSGLKKIHAFVNLSLRQFVISSLWKFCVLSYIQFTSYCTFTELQILISTCVNC